MITITNNAVTTKIINNVNIEVLDRITVDNAADCPRFECGGTDHFYAVVPKHQTPHLRRLPGSQNAMILLVGIGTASKCAIVSIDDDTDIISWTLVQDTGHRTYDRWLEGWRPQPKDSKWEYNISAEEIIRHLYSTNGIEADVVRDAIERGSVKLGPKVGFGRRSK